MLLDHLLPSTLENKKTRCQKALAAGFEGLVVSFFDYSCFSFSVLLTNTNALPPRQ
jgi:hypothetical protein